MDPIAEIFAKLEIDLLKGMTGNLAQGNWRYNRLKAFLDFRENNQKLLSSSTVDDKLVKELRAAYKKAKLTEENKLQERLGDRPPYVNFKVDPERMNMLIDDIRGNFGQAQVAALRRAEDIYRTSIYQAETALASNLYTLTGAVDMAVKSYLEKGINCITYKNGNVMNIASYAEMALRTANRRITLMAEGEARAEWGIYTVLISQYGACSKTCLPWQGRVYFDDVFSGGNPANNTGKHPLLSVAIQAGLFHPNCRHKSSTWYEDVSSMPEPIDAQTATRNSALEEQQRYNERQIRKWKRVRDCSVTPEQQELGIKKVAQWQAKQRELINKYPDILRRDYSREKIWAPPVKPKATIKEHTPYIMEFRDQVEHVKKITGADYDTSIQYVSSIREFTGSGYREMRAAIYQNDPLQPSAYYGKAVQLEDFIDKAPLWDGEGVYRGVALSNDDFAQLIVGRTDLNMAGTSSWSTDKDIAQSFARMNRHKEAKPNKVIFESAKTKQGTSIVFGSNSPHESEILISNKARWKIVEVNDYTDFTQVIVEEL